jgi:hypothetical protein
LPAREPLKQPLAQGTPIALAIGVNTHFFHCLVRRLGVVVSIASLFFSQGSVHAFETDQYNLPTKPLADIGREVSDQVEAQIRRAVETVNAEIALKQNCLAAERKGCGPLAVEQSKLEVLRSEDRITREVFERLGDGFPPFTRMGTWMDTHRFVSQPARYRTSYLKSIFILNPTIAFTISPTVNLYGAEFGTDKIAHIFQQGYTYYQTYRSGLREGLTPEEARQRAVSWGQKSERTFYGTMVGGVYSNGDLASNYAGWKFYEGLTRTVRIGDTSRPAVLELSGGIWKITEEVNLSEVLLKPFISDHLNEALNPSVFSGNLGWRAFIRRAVKKRSCERWIKRYPGLAREGLEEKSRALQLWFGEDYGFTGNEHFVTIANTCFEESKG